MVLSGNNAFGGRAATCAMGDRRVVGTAQVIESNPANTEAPACQTHRETAKRRAFRSFKKALADGAGRYSGPA